MRYGFPLFLFCALAALPADAQTFTQTFTLGDGAPGKQTIVFPEDQKLMFEAAQKITKRDYKGAETLYSQAIAINPGNTEAYIQRAVARREMGNRAAAFADAQQAVLLDNAALQKDPNNPNLYYQRGMGFRLLQQFAPARQDIRTGMRLGGKAEWENDLHAIDLEEKEAQSAPQ